MTRTLFIYLFKKFYFLFFAFLISIVTLVYFIDLIEVMRIFSEDGIAIYNAFKISALKMPFLIIELLPFIILFSSVSLFLTISRTSELHIIKSIGLSTFQILSPLFFACAIIGVFVLLIFNPFAIWTQLQYEVQESELAGKSNDANVIRSGETFHNYINEERITIMLDRVVPNRNDNNILNVFNGMIIFGDNGNITKLMEFRSAKVVSNKWSISGIKQTDYTNNAITNVDSYELNLDIDAKDLLAKIIDPKFLNIYQITDYIFKFKDVNLVTQGHKLLWHQYLSLPFLILVLSMIGAVLSMNKNRHIKPLLIILRSIAVGLLVYIAMQMFLSLGQNNVMRAAIAVWLPIIFGIVLSVYIILRREET